jgi:hypothetical protein
MEKILNTNKKRMRTATIFLCILITIVIILFSIILSKINKTNTTIPPKPPTYTTVKHKNCYSYEVLVNRGENSFCVSNNTSCIPSECSDGSSINVPNSCYNEYCLRNCNGDSDCENDCRDKCETAPSYTVNCPSPISCPSKPIDPNNPTPWDPINPPNPTPWNPINPNPAPIPIPPAPIPIPPAPIPIPPAPIPIPPAPIPINPKYYN